MVQLTPFVRIIEASAFGYLEPSINAMIEDQIAEGNLFLSVQVIATDLVRGQFAALLTFERVAS